jgi:hypothetical protein
MMFVSTTLVNGLEDVLNPRFRKISFESAPSQLTVVSALRHGWKMTPPENFETKEIPSETVRAVIQDWLEKGRKPYADDPQNVNKDMIETPWRQEILKACKFLLSCKT